jgi:hypothetical protein
MRVFICFALLALAGCQQLGQYDRTYSVAYADASGAQISGSVRLRPTGGLAK